MAKSPDTKHVITPSDLAQHLRRSADRLDEGEDWRREVQYLRDYTDLLSHYLAYNEVASFVD